MDMKPNIGGSLVMNRREALKRASLFLGVAVSASTMSGVLHAQSRGGRSKRKFDNLSRGQYGVVEAISDRILPKTDTLGALDVGVPEWIDLMYGEFLSDEEKTVFSKGITGLNRTSRKAHKSIFAKLTGDQRDEVLMGLAESDSTFFKKARELTITGYFTSEKVMKEVLNYDFIPGMWEGCVPITEVGNKVWAH